MIYAISSIHSINHTHAHSHSYSLTHHHTIHTNHTISHIHPITRSTILSFVDAHKHTITLYYMKMFAGLSFTQGLMKLSNSVKYAIQFFHSINHTLMLTHILIYSLTLKKITNQQPLTSPIKTETRSMSQILNHLLIHKSFCNALIHSLCTLQSTHLSGHHFGHQDDSPTVVGIPWNDSKLQRLLEWFYWTGGTDITIAILGRYEPSFQPFVTKMLQHGWLTIRLKISVRVWEIVPKSVCLTVLLRLYTGVHQRMAWIGQPWKLMAPVVTDVGQDWPTSATHGAAYLAHGHEFCENF